MPYATYSDDEEAIIKQGIAAIRAYFAQADEQGKKNLLFCLDKFLDPWFGYDLPYADDIFRFLEEVVISDAECFDVRKDALDLIRSYGPAPEMLAEHLERLPASLKFDAKTIVAESKGVL